MLRSRLLRVLPALVFCAPSLAFQSPIQDIGLSPATPPPDPDLVIVRERSYGAAGVNLSAYGLGTPDYVQSVYFRLFVDTNAATTKAVAGRIVFPPQVQILGIITDGTQLGGDTDDGVYTATDLLFGVGTNPNDYSEAGRGFESTGGAGGLESICQTAPNILAFALNVQNGVDDFRVILDYGTSFPTDLSFDVSTYDIGTLGGVPLSPGYRIGDVGGAVPGSGDFGEVGSVREIPLTAASPTVPSGPIPSVPANNVYMLRDTSGNSYVDHFDVALQLPAPEQYQLPAPQMATPVGLCAGPDNNLFALSSVDALSRIDLAGQTVSTVTIANLAGSNVDVCGFDGLRTLFFLRDNSQTKHVDIFDVDTLTFGASYSIPSTVLGTPKAITAATDGFLYLIGAGGTLVKLDPLTGLYSSSLSAPPTGTYVDACASSASATLYLARDTSGDTFIDHVDLSTGSVTFGIASTNAVLAPVGLCLGPQGHLFLVGSGASGAAGLVEFDPMTGSSLLSNTCMDFPGSNVDIAFALPFTAPAYCQAKLNSQGCAPQIAASGVASVSNPNPFVVSASLVLNNKAGILFYGYNSQSIPFQGGTLCIQQPVRRTPTQFSGGNAPPDDCSGAFQFDFNALIDLGSDPLLVQGQRVYCQYWYRDPADPLGFTTGLTTALGFTILP
ncbi:MAG: hypothetical protein HUU28_06670 [Planctomycetaceae bacterium]|nr:hypothetical protein [Planctomycetaceae bacterium]